MAGFLIASPGHVNFMSEKQDLSSLIRSLASENKRFEAADALISLGGRSVEPLLAALKFENWKIRGNAAWTLGKIKDPRAVDSLIEALNDAVPEVRATAGCALINIGEPSIDPLLRYVQNGNPASKGLAACILSAILGDEEEAGKERQCNLTNIV